MIGLVAQRRQRLRRRITPNSNTRTTTMINTHNHPDMAASLVGAGAGRGDATAAHPGKQLGHGQAVTWAGIGGCAARGLARTPAPRDLPAALGWPGGCQTGSRPRVGAGGAEPFGPRPASPAPAVSTRTARGGPAGGNRPDATTASPTGEVGEAEKSLPCLGGGTIQAGYAETQWQTQRRRRRTDGARLRRNPNLRRGRLHRPALPV
jgi:hypothetical protein